MAEIHYNFWGEELYSKQKALEGKFSLLHEERALIVEESSGGWLKSREEAAGASRL